MYEDRFSKIAWHGENANIKEMEKLNNFTVNEVQSLMDRELVTQEQVSAYVSVWNESSHFCVLKQWGQSLVLEDK